MDTNGGEDNTAGIASGRGSDEGVSQDAKSHNFRKRRLSLPRHHIESNASSPRTTGVERNIASGDDVSTSPVEASNGDAGASSKPTQAQQDDKVTNNQKDLDSEAEEKAHTFRKRRLSLTLKRQPDGQQEVELKLESGDNDGDDGAEMEDGRDRKRARRLHSMESTSSNLEETTSPPKTPVRATLQRTQSRILHSGEMMSGQLAPPSPVHHPVLHNQKNVLPPSQTSLLEEHLSDDGGDHHTLQSNSMEFSPRRSTRKKRRHSWKKRHHHVDEEKLPFPKDVVGTYSCHGVEPIYDDSDYEEQQPDAVEQGDEEDDGGYWGDESEEAAVDSQTQNVDCGANTEEQQQQQQQQPDDDEDREESPSQPEESESNDQENAGEFIEKPAPPAAGMSAKINQDRGGITYPYANNERTALFSVYDGHGQGGELVSQFALHEIQRRLEKHEDFHSDLQKAMRETFLSVDDALKDEPIIEPYFAGTTACVALLQDKKMTLANAGDSRAVMARKRPDGQWDGIDLTVDQNPDSPDEMDRILKRGGYVSPPPGPGLSARVWLDEEMTQIGLAMARSIGDHAVADVGVIAEPVVSSYNIAEEDDFMILASDGVWEFIESHEAVQIVGDHLDELGATKACQALIEAAASKWHEEEGEYRDDITAIVVRVQHLWGK